MIVPRFVVTRKALTFTPVLAPKIGGCSGKNPRLVNRLSPRRTVDWFLYLGLYDLPIIGLITVAKVQW